MRGMTAVANRAIAFGRFASPRRFRPRVSRLASGPSLPGAIGTIEATTSVYPGYPRRVEVTGSNGTAIVEGDTLVSVDLRGSGDPSGAKVALLINRGERGVTYVMPDLIGVNGDRAADLLRAKGFRVAVVGEHPYPGVPSGIVLRQRPDGGFQIAPGEPISLEVSR